MGKARGPVDLSRTLRLVWQSGPGWMVASAVLLVVQSLLPLLGLYLVKLVVDAAATALTSPDDRVAFEHVALLIGLIGVTALVGALCRSLAELVGEAQGQAVTDGMHGMLHAKSIEVDLEYYEDSQYHDTLHRAQQQAPFRPTRIVNGLLTAGQNGISLLTMVGLLVSFHWAIATVLLVAALPGALVRLRYAGKLFRWQRRHTPTERRAMYLNWILTGDIHAKEIRLFGLGALFGNRYSDLRQQLRRERLEIATRRSVAELVAQISATIATVGSYGFIAFRAVHGAITIGDLVMYFQAFQRGQTHLRELLRNLAGLYEDSLFLSNFYEFLDLQRKVIDPCRPSLVPRPMQTGIVFDRVAFRYPTSTRDVLHNISLCIRPGEVVALVGENGSGKTTLIKLLCRLYDPTHGSITLDGIDLREFETAALRREMSVLLQDYSRYHLTARENIWFGNLGLAPNDQRIVSAARQAGADSLIADLPRGYDTVLGKRFEDGEELSIGEWQKVALARAFVRDAQIIILDEPSSALDAQAEYEIFTRFRQLVENRAAVLVSHRFSTVRMADCIHVLANGQIIERGPHDELIRREGVYARFFERQACSYR